MLWRSCATPLWQPAGTAGAGDEVLEAVGDEVLAVPETDPTAELPQALTAKRRGGHQTADAQQKPSPRIAHEAQRRRSGVRERPESSG